jgi:YVTN family beta-propeller protein
LAAAQGKKPAPAATRSSPIAITHSDDFDWSVNPDNDSVSVLDVADDHNTKIAEIEVGKEPWCVALTPDDDKAYVTNMASGTVSVVSAHQKKVIESLESARSRSAARSRQTAGSCTSPINRPTRSRLSTQSAIESSRRLPTLE